MNPKVSLIVLNWKSKDFIEECLDSLTLQTYLNLEIIVVDNGSNDGSLARIKTKYGEAVKLIENPGNLGFSHAVNQGISQALGEWIGLVNSDAALKANWTEEMVKAAISSPKNGMAACKIYLSGRENVLDNTGELITRDGMGQGRGRLQKDSGQFDKNNSVLCPSGCAGLYKKSMLEEIGLFDARFFAYGEDIDIGLRARRAGYEAVYTPRAVAFHRLSAASGRLSGMKAYLLERNRLWVVIKCFPARYLLASFFYTFLRYVYIIYGMLNKKGSGAVFSEHSSHGNLLAQLLKAYGSTILNLPYLLRQRTAFRSKIKTSTQDFGAWIREHEIGVKQATLKDLA